VVGFVSILAESVVDKVQRDSVKEPESRGQTSISGILQGLIDRSDRRRVNQAKSAVGAGSGDPELEESTGDGRS
jgi:hypothetical protein